VKKKCREEFENKKVAMGILALKNCENGKIFLKPTLNAEAWINKAKFMLNNGQFENVDLQYEWTIMGEDRFTFEMLEVLKENDSPFFNHQKALVKMKEAICESLVERRIIHY
jgi:hypothetical protein